MYVLAVIGSRDFADYTLLCLVLDEYRKIYPEITFVSGGARGADRFAARYALSHGIEIQEILPKWDMYGKRAGFMRNSGIVAAADEVLAFWDGQSKGTQDSIKKAQQANKLLTIIDYTKE